MFKLASFNVNSIRVRMNIVLDWLEKERPDALCLQETKVEDGYFPISEFQSAGYNVAFRGQKTYNGVAVISPHEIKETGYENSFDSRAGEARILTVVIKEVNIINTYIPQGQEPGSERFVQKINWIRELRDFFEANYQREDKIVWTGDFNVAPEALDVYAPDKLFGQTGFHPEEHKSLQYVKDWGFSDIFRQHVKEGGHYTFWDYRVPSLLKNNKGWRIDHIWASRPMAELSTRAWIDTGPRFQPRPSDHTFIAAEFNL
jgi:exodeoxyribonuclease-3